MGYPCDLKQKIEAAGGALEACLVELGISDERREAFRKLLETGDRAGVMDALSKVYAAMHGIHEREALAIILDGGFAIEQTVYGKEGEIGTRLIQNPRAMPFLELTKLLGLTGDQQAVTPKARGETQQAISTAKHLDWMRDFEKTTGRGNQAPTKDAQ